MVFVKIILITKKHLGGVNALLSGVLLEELRVLDLWIIFFETIVITCSCV